MRWLAFGAVLAVIAAACSAGLEPTTTTSTTAAAPATTTTTPPTTEPDPEDTIPPDVDLTIHSVPLEDIHFDTFDGRSVPLSNTSPELRSILLDFIPPIDDPVYGDAAAGDWLEPADLVLGYVAGARPYAYPFKILNFHEIVNDELDGVPVLISYCPLCRSGIVYDRRIDGEALSFGNTSALYESDLVMVDRSTGSYWWQVAGTAIVGPLTGNALTPLPSTVATWEEWKAQHPDTLVLKRDTGFARPYERDVFADFGDVVDAGQFPFPVGEAALDPRLPASALVVGVSSGGETRAYPVEGLLEPVNDEVGGTPLVVFPIEGGASVFGAVLDGETLTFVGTGRGFEDVETGSVWTPAGWAVSGPLQGSVLDPIPSRTTFWFAFISAFPNTEVHPG